MDDQTRIVKSLAPEEIRAGRYVSVLHQLVEHGPWCCPGPESFGAKEPVRMQWLPDEGDLPMKVTVVCLPFVLAESADGSHRVLDVRRHRLARVSKRFGRVAFRRLGPKARRRRRRVEKH